MLLPFRSLDKSVRAAVTALFTSPPAGTLPSAWNVYGEDQFASDSFIPTPPHVFLLEARVRPRQTRLPLVQIERASAAYAPFEVGTHAGTGFVYNLHVFARNRGERGDLAAFLYRNLERIQIYDFTVNPAAMLYTVAIESKASVIQAQREDIGLEGALLNFESVVFAIDTRE